MQKYIGRCLFCKFLLTNPRLCHIVHFMNFMVQILNFPEVAMEPLNEELLSAWLRLSSAIDNQRLVKGLSFNEALVCNLLARANRAGQTLTARDLCAQTRILKSQMNAILLSLEKHGVIQRRQSQHDRRQIELLLLPEGLQGYHASHANILALIDRLIEQMGVDKIRQLIPLLHQVVDTFDMIQQEAST